MSDSEIKINAIIETLDAYLDENDRLTRGTASPFLYGAPKTLPYLRRGVPLYDVTDDWIEHDLGGRDNMHPGLLRLWNTVLRASRGNGNKAAALKEFAQGMFALLEREWAAKRETPPADSTATLAAVSKNGKLILAALLTHYPTLLIIEEINGAIPDKMQLATRTIGPEVNKLIDAGLVERPQGERKGATLTPTGNALAEKLAAS